MKEYPEPNYFVEISPAENPADHALWLTDTYEIRINRIVCVAIMPWFPHAPWPDELPVDEGIVTREEFAWCTASPAVVVIAPAEDGVPTREVIVRSDVHGARNTIFWIEPAVYRRIVDEVIDRLDRPCGDPRGRSTRLFELSGTELGTLLREKLPQAALCESERKILCLP